jgi:Mrp family chromosome partitioning ATPase
MGELREEFDYVLINSSPVCSFEDAVLLGQMADGLILVVEANSTRREAAQVAKNTCECAKVRLIGAILNNRTFPIPEALYRKL